MPTPHNITSPLALPIQRQIPHFPFTLILTNHIFNPAPTLHNLHLPTTINLISPRNRLPQFPLHHPTLRFPSSRNKNLRLQPLRFQSPLLIDKRSLVHRDGNFNFDDDFMPLALRDGVVVLSDRFPGVAARSKQ